MSKDNKQEIFALIERVRKANNEQDTASTANLYSSIEALLKADPSIINEKNELQRTPLLATLMYKNPDIYLIELFINAGADVNAKTRSGQTPLKLASQEGHHEVVESLLKAGADVNATDNQGTSALYLPAERGYDKVVKLLLEKGADANAKNHKGIPTLYIAAQEGHHKVVKLLLEKGADAKATDNEGTPALFMAAQEGHYEVVKLLLEKDADAKATYEQTSALYIAVQKKHLEIMRLLLEKKASFDTKTGKDALLMAVLNSHYELVKLLLDAGADISETGIAAVNSILGMAIRNGNIKIVEALIDTKNFKIFGPINRPVKHLKLAARNKNLEATKLLLKELSFPSSQIEDALKCNKHLLSSLIDEASNYLNLQQKQGKDTKNIGGLLITMKESLTLLWSNNKIVESVNTLLNNNDIYNLIPSKNINDFLTIRDIHNLLKKAQGTNIESIEFITTASSQDTTPTSTKHTDKTQEIYGSWNDEDNTTLSTSESSNNNSNVQSSSSLHDGQTGNENNQSDVNTTGSSTDYSSWND